MHTEPRYPHNTNAMCSKILTPWAATLEGYSDAAAIIFLIAKIDILEECMAEQNLSPGMTAFDGEIIILTLNQWLDAVKQRYAASFEVAA